MIRDSSKYLKLLRIAIFNAGVLGGNSMHVG